MKGTEAQIVHAVALLISYFLPTDNLRELLTFLQGLVSNVVVVVCVFVDFTLLADHIPILFCILGIFTLINAFPVFLLFVSAVGGSVSSCIIQLPGFKDRTAFTFFRKTAGSLFNYDLHETITETAACDRAKVAGERRRENTVTRTVLL